MTHCKNKKKEKEKEKENLNLGNHPMFLMVTKVEYGVNKLLMY